MKRAGVCELARRREESARRSGEKGSAEEVGAESKGEEIPGTGVEWIKGANEKRFGSHGGTAPEGVFVATADSAREMSRGDGREEEERELSEVSSESVDV